jgi:hypothetical protein
MLPQEQGYARSKGLSMTSDGRSYISVGTLPHNALQPNGRFRYLISSSLGKTMNDGQ